MAAEYYAECPRIKHCKPSSQLNGWSLANLGQSQQAHLDEMHTDQHASHWTVIMLVRGANT